MADEPILVEIEKKSTRGKKWTDEDIKEMLEAAVEIKVSYFLLLINILKV